jgi:hypothetical protein
VGGGMGSRGGERQMNQGARDANEEIARHAAASRQDQQIKLLEEIRNLLVAISVFLAERRRGKQTRTASSRGGRT